MMDDIDCTPAEDCLVLACDVAVRRALELASKRMLTRNLLSLDLRDVPPWQRYTRLPRCTDLIRQGEVLNGAWSCLPDELGGVLPMLDRYTRSLLVTGDLHTTAALRQVIQQELSAA
jgi:hypothetical protein